MNRAPEKAEDFAPSPPSVVDDNTPGILVIDDDGPVLQLLEFALSQEGFRVWTAEDGHDAVALYQQHRSEVGLVILDVQMPDLDGPQTLERLRQIDPEVRCCFMSAGSGVYSLHQLRQMGACCFFPKPLNLASLLHLVRRQLCLAVALRQPVPSLNPFA